MRRRALSWSAALRDLNSDRLLRQDVREERSRSLGRLCSRPAMALSAWRGRSGRRYVVQILTLAQAAEVEAPGSVILGVRRDAEGHAVIVGAGHRGTVGEALSLARADRTTEIHLHRLEDSEDARDAIVDDLIGDDAV